MASIIALADGLRLHTVAEGVETFTQLDVLRTLGCRSVQGFLLARSLPADAIEASARRTQPAMLEKVA